MLELETQLEQQALLEDSRGDIRMPDGTQVDGVKTAQRLDSALWQDLSRLHVALAAEVKIFGAVLKAVFLADGIEDLESLGDDFGAGSISPQDS